MWHVAVVVVAALSEHIQKLLSRAIRTMVPDDDALERETAASLLAAQIANYVSHPPSLPPQSLSS